MSTKTYRSPGEGSSTPGQPGNTPATVHLIHHRGATYELRLVCCNKQNCTKCNDNGRMRPSHGPYWYLCYTSHSKTCRAYLGKDLDTTLFRDENGHISIALIRAGKPKRSPVPIGHVGGPAQVDMLEHPPDPDAPESKSFRQKFRTWLHGSQDPPKDV